MFVLRVKESFSAAHFIPDHPGECRNLHGHTYSVEIFFEAAEPDRTGMVADFGDLKKIVRELLKEFDHKCLNDIAVVGANPTSEILCRHLYEKLHQKINSQYLACKAKAVRLWESESTYVEYSE